MEQKKIRLSLIFSSVIFAIGVAINSIGSYFFGFGVAFVAVLTLFVFNLAFALASKEIRKRTIDEVIMSGVCLFLVTILYCVYEWALQITERLYNFVKVFSNVYSIISLIFLVYGLIRIVCEFNGIKIKLFDVILRNKDKQVKEQSTRTRENRQLREVMNGDLEQKPMADKSKYNEYTASQDRYVSNNQTIYSPNNYSEQQEKINQSLNNYNEATNTTENVQEHSENIQTENKENVENSTSNQN